MQIIMGLIGMVVLLAIAGGLDSDKMCEDFGGAG